MSDDLLSGNMPSGIVPRGKEPSVEVPSEKYWGCPCCDLLVEKVSLDYREKALCPRCNKTLQQPINKSVEKTLAISISALILFFPAMILPIMSMNILGNVRTQTVLESVFAVFNDGHFFVAILVFLTCVFVPLLKISILFYVSFALYRKIKLPMLRFSYRVYHDIEEWGMLEIYMLGIIVSIVKLEGMSQLSFNIGLLIFACLLLLTLMSSVFMDEHFYWEKIEDLQ